MTERVWDGWSLCIQLLSEKKWRLVFKEPLSFSHSLGPESQPLGYWYIHSFSPCLLEVKPLWKLSHSCGHQVVCFLWFLKSVKLAVNISDPVHITTSVPIIAYFLVHKTFSSSYPCPTATWNKQCINCKQYAFLRSTSKIWDVLLFSTSTWISHSSNCPHCAGYLSINPLVVLCDKSTQNISYYFIFSTPYFI